jgi:hypothetical protein
MAQEALFEGLVSDEEGRPVTVTHVGDRAVYVINDNGFLRHVDAEDIDRPVLTIIIEQLRDNKDVAIAQALAMLGQDDLFTKAAVDASIRNINLDQIINQGIPLQAREMLGMLGFAIVVNYHGEIVRFDQPAAPDE